MSLTHRACAVLVTSVFVLLAALGTAQAQIPDKFINLKILPADVPRGELVGIMRGFASALGVRCQHCHVGKTDDLRGYDFASDDKEPKRIARVMMEMTRAINKELLPKIGRSERLEVECVTCHRGLQRPETIYALLRREIQKDGLAAALKHYRELRDQHGRDGAYDFSAKSLNKLGEALSRSKDTASAITVMRLAVELNPESAYSYFLLGSMLAESGDRDGGLSALEKAVSLEPENTWYGEELAKLKAKKK